MAEWIEPIYDRTQSDVDRVIYLKTRMLQRLATDSEIAEWSTDLRGALNISDVNRVINNILVLSDELQLNIQMDNVTVYDLPHITWCSTLLENVSKIKQAYPAKSDNMPKSPLNTYEKWNTIEKILFDIYRILKAQFYYYCGDELYTGDTIGNLL